MRSSRVNLWYTQLPIALVLIALNIRAVVKLEPLATVDSRELFQVVRGRSQPM